MVASLRRLGAAAGLALAAAGCGPASPRVRSVVLVVVDTLRADHLSTYGYARPTAPGLDARAKQGALFERAFATSSWTLPSFASLYTGLLPHQHGVGRAPDGSGYTALDPSIAALAEILAQHGFATAAVANNPFLAPAFGLARGFESYQYIYGNTLHQPRASQVIWAGLRWLDERDPKRPFLLLLHCFDPHLPYDAPAPARGAFAPESAGSLVRPLRGFGDANAGWAPRDPDERRFAIGSYDEELLFVDQQLPHLFEGLAERGLLGETLVVLTADHGEELFDHGGFEHGHSMHQELLHVPLVLWGPGIAARRIETPVSLVDVTPTLLDALGLPPLPGAAGVSLWPLVARGEALAPRTLAAEGTLHGPERSAVVRWPWKLLAVEGGAPQLYDLASDPGEERDLAAAEPERVRELAAEIAAPAAPAGAPSPSLDPAIREQLEELGYAH